MPVISDTSPLNYLVLIEQIQILPRLFGEITIPESVSEELRHPNAPEKIKAFLSTQPGWLKVVSDVSGANFPGIDPGETAAIHLAKSTQADFILMDDAAGRQIAKNIGLTVLGTIGLLEKGAEEKWLDLGDVFTKLKLQTTFRVSPEFLNERLVKFRNRNPIR